MIVFAVVVIDDIAVAVAAAVELAFEQACDDYKYAVGNVVSQRSHVVDAGVNKQTVVTWMMIDAVSDAGVDRLIVVVV